MILLHESVQTLVGLLLEADGGRGIWILRAMLERAAYGLEVNKIAMRLGVENAYIQAGGTAKESFIPPFDGK